MIKENIKVPRHWTGEFPAQMASYAENVSIWWRHHGWAPLFGGTGNIVLNEICRTQHYNKPRTFAMVKQDTEVPIFESTQIIFLYNKKCLKFQRIKKCRLQKVKFTPKSQKHSDTWQKIIQCTRLLISALVKGWLDDQGAYNRNQPYNVRLLSNKSARRGDICIIEISSSARYNSVKRSY